jgi:hypothetical protein
MTSANGQYELSFGQRQIADHSGQAVAGSASNNNAGPVRGNGSHPPPAIRPITPTLDLIPIERSSDHRRSSAGRVVTGATLALTGIALACGGLAMTVAYMVSTATGFDRILLGGLAAASDVLALLTPAGAAYLWRARRRVPAVIAGVLWIISATTTFQNLCGFVGTYGDSFVAGRQAASTQRSMLFDRLARLRSERKAISETRSAGEITIAIRNASSKRIDDERMALQQARHRDQIDSDLATIEQSIGNSPNLSEADPSSAAVVGIVSLISGGRLVIADDLFRRLRLLALVTLPLLGGLILATGIALTAKEREP